MTMEGTGMALQLRSLVISGRWDERLKLMRLGRKSINQHGTRSRFSAKDFVCA